MSKDTTSTPDRERSAEVACYATFLECDARAWFVSAASLTPSVAAVCIASVEITEIRFVAGVMVGLWAAMWHVILWAKLTRRESHNARSAGDRRQQSTQ